MHASAMRNYVRGALALGVLVDWREVNSNPRAVLMFDVETFDGISFRGIADEDLTITELTRLAPGQTLPVRYRPASWTTTSPLPGTRTPPTCSSSLTRSRAASGPDPKPLAGSLGAQPKE